MEYKVPIKGNIGTFSFLVSPEMNDSFRKSTKDDNPIHDPSLTPKPVVLGFLLESILETIAEHNNPIPDLIPAHQTVNFRDQVYVNDPLYGLMTVHNSAVEFYLEDKPFIEIPKKPKALYSVHFLTPDQLKEQREEPQRQDLMDIILEEDIKGFCKGIGLEDAPKFPFMAGISRLSKIILQYFQENPDKKPTNKFLSYTSHEINIFKDMLNLVSGRPTYYNL